MTAKQSKNRDVKPRPEMVKVTEMKEDGRILIYYFFADDQKKKDTTADDAACVSSKESS